MRQDTLSPSAGSKRDKKRFGRGPGSGHGRFSGRGCKGQKSRAGNQKMPRGYEGGQNPIFKRLPGKRGFFNKFREEYNVVNLSTFDSFESGSEITAETLYNAGFIDNTSTPLKVLASGEITKSLTITANKFSSAAKSRIEAAGGKVVEI